MKMAIAKVRSSSAQRRRSTGNTRKVVNARLKEKFEPAHALAGRRNEVRIGMRLKHARLSKGYTLKELAKIAECSESMISKVENDKLRPSIAMLHRFAQALETNIASLISEPDPNAGLVTIVRDNQRPRIHVDPELQGADVWLERVIPPSNGGLLQSHVLNLSPKGRSDGLIRHTGEELGFVITGEVDLEVEGVIYHLQAGDSFFFSSSLAHGYYNKGKKITRILWVNTPPSF
jgi:transcriptional regulator with XRE-family HTH domain